MTSVTRKRGRPASIDSDAAMQAVVELFRAKGYAAVSLDELSAETGLSRPSLYRAFGNKLSMYIGAMDAFGAQVAEIAVPALQEDVAVETALSNFFSAMLSIYYRDAAVTPGCLVFATAPSSADEAAIKTRLAFGIEQLDLLMRARLLSAFPDCDASHLETAAYIAANTLIAFSARAKAGATKSALQDIGAETAQAMSALLNCSRGGTIDQAPIGETETESG